MEGDTHACNSVRINQTYLKCQPCLHYYSLTHCVFHHNTVFQYTCLSPQHNKRIEMYPCPLVYLWSLEKCLAQSIYLINVCRIILPNQVKS